MRRRGWTLIGAGVLGAAFFIATDPRYGLVTLQSTLVIDAANEALVGTAVGVACSLTVLVIGVWMLARKTL